MNCALLRPIAIKDCDRPKKHKVCTLNSGDEEKIWTSLTHPDDHPEACSGLDCIGKGWFWEDSETPLKAAHINIHSNGMDHGGDSNCVVYNKAQQKLETIDCTTRISFTICQLQTCP